jgi:peroxiredoxin
MRPPIAGPVRGPLARGEAVPELACAGWLNGDPKPFASDGPKVHVLDVWAAWCPYCGATAPGLVRLHAKYRDRGVQFISVTDQPKATAEAFVRAHAIPWPSGYGLPADAVAKLGTVNNVMMPGHLVAPTFFVVGPDGKVRGSADQGRWHHAAPDDAVAKLDRAIEEALKMTAPPAEH